MTHTYKGYTATITTHVLGSDFIFGFFGYLTLESPFIQCVSGEQSFDDEFELTKEIYKKYFEQSVDKYLAVSN